MPEYLAPGVYLEESDANVTPIPGVSTSTIDDATARALLAAIAPIIKRTQPDWTGFDQSDPGITLVQLFAWLAESTIYRLPAGTTPQRQAVIRAVRDVARAAACAHERPLRRPTFFDGQLLDAESLRREQQYHRDKHRLHNLTVHGFGIVSGLEVSVDTSDDSDANWIVVEAGCAIDRRGEEVAIGERVRVPLSVKGDGAFVSLVHCEHRCTEASTHSPSAHSDCIEEACLIAIADNVSGSALALARLARSGAGWAVDTSFAAPRARSR